MTDEIVGFGGKEVVARISEDRLAAVTGVAHAGAVGAAAKPRRTAEQRKLVEPDLSRIRRRGLEETPEEQKRRLAAKAVNFSTSFIVRLAIIAAAVMYAREVYESTGAIHRGIAICLFIMCADYGRLIMKAMTHGTK